ncbi:hypothetical protein [Gymnodinialimonas hymeniacidonis]|uniref:hypothetical protein n=1 Tax=Gymnodinialimonas hymeniacidonis TaxID=3126508 RepID=UPI0034C668A4
MSTEADRAALMARQGMGARYDAPQAPAKELLLARRGTAYFARVLNGLTDEALMQKGPAKAVAEVGYHARALAVGLASVRTGAPAEPVRVAKDVTSLPARALRGLFHHSAIHLDVEWRDLPGPMWPVAVLPDGTRAIETPLQRAEHVWRQAVLIGGRLTDLPAQFR